MVTAEDEAAGRVAWVQARAANAGPVVNGTVPTGNLAGPCVFLVGPEALAFAYGEGRAAFGSSAGWRPLIGRRFGEAVINRDEPEHARERRGWAPALSARALAVHLPRLDAQIARAAERWRAAGRIDAYAAARELAFVAVATTIGELTEADAVALAADYGEVIMPPGDAQASAARHPMTLPARQRIEQRLAAAAARLGAGDRPGLLSTLRRHDRDLAPADLARHLGILLLVGHETTASLLAWILALLARRPDWEARVASELASLPRTPSLADLERLPATDAFIAETGRLYPPVQNAPRVALREIEFGGVAIPEGARIALAIAATDLRSAHGNAPEHFAPERFLGTSDPGVATFTFGAGARSCPGMRLAHLEAKLLLRHVLSASTVLAATREPTRHVGFWNARPMGGLALQLLPRRAVERGCATAAPHA